jgi:hypothetical protein
LHSSLQNTYSNSASNEISATVSCTGRCEQKQWIYDWLASEKYPSTNGSLAYSSPSDMVRTSISRLEQKTQRSERIHPVIAIRVLHSSSELLTRECFTGRLFLLFSRNLADHDQDGRLTPDEFVVAMHCCELLRAGQALPATLPDEWLPGNPQLRERTDSLSKGNVNSTFAGLNQQLKDTFNVANTTENNTTQSTSEQTEAELRAAAVTYEEKRLKNYEVRLSIR